MYITNLAGTGGARIGIFCPLILVLAWIWKVYFWPGVRSLMMPWYS